MKEHTELDAIVCFANEPRLPHVINLTSSATCGKLISVIAPELHHLLQFRQQLRVEDGTICSVVGFGHQHRQLRLLVQCPPRQFDKLACRRKLLLLNIQRSTIKRAVKRVLRNNLYQGFVCALF